MTVVNTIKPSGGRFDTTNVIGKVPLQQCVAPRWRIPALYCTLLTRELQLAF